MSTPAQPVSTQNFVQAMGQHVFRLGPLGAGMTAKDILAIYMEHGEKIFPPRVKLDWLISRAVQWAWHLARSLWHYRYDRAALTAELG